MPVESSTGFINSLDPLSPDGSEGVNEGDNHLRAFKQIIKNTFPNANAVINPTPTEFNFLSGVTSAIQTQINTKGAIAGQAWTGSHSFAASPSVPTPSTAAAGTEAVNAAWVLSKIASGTAENFGGQLYASAAINGGM